MRICSEIRSINYNNYDWWWWWWYTAAVVICCLQYHRAGRAQLLISCNFGFQCYRFFLSALWRKCPLRKLSGVKLWRGALSRRMATIHCSLSTTCACRCPSSTSIRRHRWWTDVKPLLHILRAVCSQPSVDRRRRLARPRFGSCCCCPVESSALYPVTTGIRSSVVTSAHKHRLAYRHFCYDGIGPCSNVVI